jgi:hypothetical protein
MEPTFYCLDALWRFLSGLLSQKSCVGLVVEVEKKVNLEYCSLLFVQAPCGCSGR